MLHIKSTIISKQRREKWEQKLFLLNPSFIEECKNAEFKEVDYVSTNDIVTSTCFQLTGADAGMMAVNFRGRIQDCGDLNAPNYINSIMYRPPDYARPELIRKSLQMKTMRRASLPPTKEIPNGPTMLLKSIHVSVCTNWSTFAQDDFSLGPDTKQLLHMPIKDMRNLAPSLISNIMIYKPNSGLTAILVLGAREMVQRMEDHPIA